MKKIASCLLCAAAAVLIVPAQARQAAQPAPTAKGVSDLEKAKREAVEVDKEIRADLPQPAKKNPDFGGGAETPLERFDKAADAAYIDRSNTRMIDQYRSPDGVVIERVTYGNKSYCITSSTHNYVPGILHDSSKAREVTCPPANAGWVRK
ncbi:MAG: hypothetical protein JWP59_3465 [Massilia sp.]|nr:hypothetical protein [Massilia sp.]